MNSLSSSFLQNYSPTPSPFSSSPPLPLHYKPQTLRIHVNYDKLTPIKTIHTPNESKTKEITARKNQPFLTTIFNSLEEFVCKFIDPPLHPFIDPKVVLSGNSAPVDELPPTACEVEEGSLPPCLDGAYIRNGPNTQFVPRGPIHLNDGDGMLHSIKISKGKATFCSRYVKTYKYTVERDIGSPVLINYFSAFTCLPATLARSAIAVGRLLSGQYNVRRGTGNANTSLAYFGGRLFAISESDLPYAVKQTPDGDVITLGRFEAYGKPLESMTAHPKVDGETGEAFAFRHGIHRPFLTYFRISADGTKQPEVPIFSKTQASLVHDFAITENYAIFPDTQIVIKPKEIIKGNSPVLVDPTKVSKLGIIPRDAEDEREMWWIEVLGFNCLHIVNAWEEDGGNSIVVVSPNVLSVEHFIWRPDLIHSSMEIIEIDVKTKMVRRRRPISTRSLDFSVINPARIGKKTKYVYSGVLAPGGLPSFTGVVKLDLSLSTTESGDCTVASRVYGPGWYGGEPFFVAKEPDNPEAAEDDGYLVTFVHDETRDESKFIVMDAKSLDLEIVAIVKLPQRVPYGFHGIFVRECDLQKV